MSGRCIVRRDFESVAVATRDPIAWHLWNVRNRRRSDDGCLDDRRRWYRFDVGGSLLLGFHVPSSSLVFLDAPDECVCQRPRSGQEEVGTLGGSDLPVNPHRGTRQTGSADAQRDTDGRVQRARRSTGV